MSARQITIPEFHAILRSHFPSFIQKCFHTLAPQAQYLPNWHIEALAYHLELVRRGKIRRLIVNMPPRSLKSIVASVAFSAYLSGHDPSIRQICVSYGFDLAAKHANDYRLILNSPWYQTLFPSTRISSVKNTESEIATTRRGYRLNTSIDGTLTGRGGDIIIIDDPLKPADALSDIKRERVNDWYYNTLLSRLDDKVSGAIIVVMQRLHLNDLAGTLLDASDEWTLLKFPAIAEEDGKVQIGDQRYHFRSVGGLLHPLREPLKVLEEYQKLMGSDTFQAQFQQEPVSPRGNMIKRNWVRTYDIPPDRNRFYIQVIQSWDTAAKEGGENDWSVCTTWFVHEGRYYLFDVFRRRLSYPDLRAAAIELARRYNPTKILIEDTGVGMGLIPELNKLGLSAIGVRPEGNKLARMAIQSAKFEAGNVLFPSFAPWLPELEAELFSFPGVRHDDQIDSISQALANAEDGYDHTYAGWQ